MNGNPPVAWRGKPLTDMRTIVELISGTRTDTGLTVQATYDNNWHQKGVKITNTQMADPPLHPHDWHGEWNYTILPTQSRDLSRGGPQIHDRSNPVVQQFLPTGCTKGVNRCAPHEPPLENRTVTGVNPRQIPAVQKAIPVEVSIMPGGHIGLLVRQHPTIPAVRCRLESGDARQEPTRACLGQRQPLCTPTPRTVRRCAHVAGDCPSYRRGRLSSDHS